MYVGLRQGSALSPQIFIAVAEVKEKSEYKGHSRLVAIRR